MSSKSTGKRTRRKKGILHSAFYRVYFALVALALVGIAVGTGWLMGLLRDYEAAQPVYVAQDVARMFEAADYDGIYALDTSAAGIAGEDRAFYVQSMREIAAGRSVAWSEVFSPSEDERRYDVTLDGDRFATFTLVPSGQTTARGNRLWTLGSVTTHVTLEEPVVEEPAVEEEPETPKQTYECRVTAPAGYAVTADGVVLTAENASTSEKAMYEDGFLPSDVQNPTLIEYVWRAESVTPSIAAADENGEPAEVVLSAEKALTWSVAMRQNEEFREKYSDAAYALAKRVARYITEDASRNSVLSYCASNSPARTIFKNLDNQWHTPHSGYTFRNGDVSNFYVLSDECFTCRVTFDYVLKTRNGEMVYPTAYTFCVVRQGSSGKLYNLVMY